MVTRDGTELDFRLDDLSGEPTRALIARHLRGMYASSPPEQVHALGIEALRQPGIEFWSAWVGDRGLRGAQAPRRPAWRDQVNASC